MNRQQRKLLAEVLKRLNDAKESVEWCSSDMNEMRDEEQDKLDNLEEHFSGTDRYDRMSEGIDTLDEIVGLIDEAVDSLDQAIEAIDVTDF